MFFAEMTRIAQQVLAKTTLAAAQEQTAALRLALHMRYQKQALTMKYAQGGDQPHEGAPFCRRNAQLPVLSDALSLAH